MTTQQLILVLVVGAYVGLGRWLVRWPGRQRNVVFGLLTLVVAGFCMNFNISGDDLHCSSAFLFLFMVYVGLVSVQYLALRYWGERMDWLAWGAFLTPIAFLVSIRYVPPSTVAHIVTALRHKLYTYHYGGFYFLGLSYLAFRTSSLAVEVRNGLVKRPGYWDYLGFAFFVPTLSVGPITRYSEYHRGFTQTDRPEIPVGRALLRTLVGAVKFGFLGPLLSQLTYGSLMLDGHWHHRMDLVIAVLVYYPFLYCNFSGFCDMAIGCAGLMGIPVMENFDNPFAARNMRELWNRWHISLSLWMRDYVFTPLSKTLVRAFGPAMANHAIALTIVVVFLLIGAWHGVGWNFVVFGASNAVGVVATHYYTIALKKRLGKERFAAYNRNRVIRAIAVTVTFVYFSVCLFFFANYSADTVRILAAISSGH